MAERRIIPWSELDDKQRAAVARLALAANDGMARGAPASGAPNDETYSSLASHALAQLLFAGLTNANSPHDDFDPDAVASNGFDMLKAQAEEAKLLRVERG